MTRVSSGAEALRIIDEKSFDLVITVPVVEDMEGTELGRQIATLKPDLPVILLAHNLRAISPPAKKADLAGISNIFVWGRDPDLLLAIIKNVEDHWNVRADTEKAQPGLKGNLIANASQQRTITDSNGKTREYRAVLGTLPAIPFEVVKPLQAAEK